MSPMAGESHIQLFYFDLSLLLTQYSIPDYMCVPLTLPFSPFHSSSSASSMVGVAMVVEEILAHPIVREYVLSSPSSEIPLSSYPSYDPITQTRFLLPKCLTNWPPVLEDYVDDDNDEKKDSSKDANDVKESSRSEEDPYEDSS